MGNLTQTETDANGETTAVIDPDGNVTQYAYDRDGRVTLTTDPNNNVTTTTYDAASRVSTVTGMLTTTYTQEIIYSFDNDNRDTGEVWKQEGSTVNTLTFTYDKQGNMLTAANSAGTITMSYRSFAATKDKEYNGVVHLGQVNWSHLGLVDHTNRKEQRREVFYCQAC